MIQIRKPRPSAPASKVLPALWLLFGIFAMTGVCLSGMSLIHSFRDKGNRIGVPSQSSAHSNAISLFHLMPIMMSKFNSTAMNRTRPLSDVGQNKTDYRRLNLSDQESNHSSDISTGLKMSNHSLGKISKPNVAAMVDISDRNDDHFVDRIDEFRFVVRVPSHHVDDLEVFLDSWLQTSTLEEMPGLYPRFQSLFQNILARTLLNYPPSIVRNENGNVTPTTTSSANQSVGVAWKVMGNKSSRRPRDAMDQFDIYHTDNIKHAYEHRFPADRRTPMIIYGHGLMHHLQHEEQRPEFDKTTQEDEERPRKKNEWFKVGVLHHKNRLMAHGYPRVQDGEGSRHMRKKYKNEHLGPVVMSNNLKDSMSAMDDVKMGGFGKSFKRSVSYMLSRLKSLPDNDLMAKTRSKRGLGASGNGKFDTISRYPRASKIVRRYPSNGKSNYVMQLHEANLRNEDLDSEHINRIKQNKMKATIDFSKRGEFEPKGKAKKSSYPARLRKAFPNVDHNDLLSHQPNADPSDGGEADWSNSGFLQDIQKLFKHHAIAYIFAVVFAAMFSVFCVFFLVCSVRSCRSSEGGGSGFKAGRWWSEKGSSVPLLSRGTNENSSNHYIWQSNKNNAAYDSEESESSCSECKYEAAARVKSKKGRAHRPRHVT